MKKSKTLANYSAFLKKLLVSGVFFSLMSAQAFATDSGGDMPWMSPLQKITASISGPIAQAAGVIVIVIAGLGIAFGEGGSGVRRLFQVVMGLAIAFTAASIVAKLFGATSGVAFQMATPGFIVKIHNSLTQPMLTAGVPRQFFIMNSTAMAAITFGMQSLYGIPICGVLHIAAVMMTKRDPYFFNVMVRHVRQKGYYSV